MFQNPGIFVICTVDTMSAVKYSFMKAVIVLLRLNHRRGIR